MDNYTNEPILDMRGVSRAKVTASELAAPDKPIEEILEDSCKHDRGAGDADDSGCCQKNCS